LVHNVGTGAAFFNFGSFTTPRLLSGTYQEEGTNANGNFYIFDGTAVDAYVEYVRNLRNLSSRQVTCKGNRGNMIQATNANMPWSSDPMAPTSKPVNGRRVMYFDGVADYMTVPSSTGNFNFMHNGSGGTLFMVLQRDAGDYILSNGNATVGDIGIALRYIGLSVGNGSGAYLVNQAFALAAGYNILEVGMGNAATGYDTTVNGATVSGPYVGAPSAAPATYDMYVGRRPSGNYMQARLPFLFTFNEHLAPADPRRVSMRNYLKARYGL
jgi:hypothetical protein